MSAQTAESTDQGRPRYGEGREALLRAAIRVVAEAGLRNLTYRSVAREAGVTHGLVAHHFGSRDALLEEALRYSLDLSLDASRMLPTTGRLEDVADGLADMAAEDPDLQAFQFELILESRRRPELRPHVDALYAGYRDYTRRTMRSVGVTDPAVSDLAFAAMDGLVFQQLASGDAEATRRGLRTLRDLLRAASATSGSSGD